MVEGKFQNETNYSVKRKEATEYSSTVEHQTCNLNVADSISAIR